MTRYSSTMTEALQEIREGFSPKQIKMAIGIAADPRYKGGNYSGAYKQIEKIKKGLADHPQVAAVLKRLNTDFDPEMVEDWEDVSENSFDLTELAMPRRDFDKLKKGDKVTITYDSSIKKGHVTTFEVKGRSRSAKYKVDKITMQPEGAPSGRMKYYLYSRDGGDATLAMGDMGASMTKIKMEGLKEAAHALAEKLKVSDGVGAWIKDFQKSDAPQFQGKSEEDRKKMALAAFADAGGKLEETELDEGRMKELHGYIEKGMSAQEIAKKMKLDVKTIKSLMDETELGEQFEYVLVDKDNKVIGVFGTKQRAKDFEPKAKKQPALKNRLPLRIQPIKPKSKKVGDTVIGIGEEVELDEAPKMKYALVGTDMKIYSMGSDERDLKLDRRSLEQRFKDVAPLKMARLKTAQSIGDKVDKSQLKEEEGPDNRPDSAKEVEQGRDDKKKTRIAQLQLQIAKAQETINKLNAQEKPNG